MKKAKLALSRDFAFAEIDKRIYGSFVEHLGAGVYNGIYEPGSPLSDETGCRTDVLKAVQELGPTVLRYPGGNYTSGYDWEDTVGPVDKRPARLDFAWGVTEPNTFGLDEFYQWNEKVGSEFIMTLNTGTRGVADAMHVLEYCNHPGGSKYADLRVAHGRKQPYNFRTWCIGNEMDGPWQIGHKTGTEYGRLCAEIANVFRMYDPGLQLVACGDSGSAFSWYPEYDRLLLAECYDVVDYIALHMYIHKEQWRPEQDAYAQTKPEYDTASFLASPIEMDRHIKTIAGLCDYMQAVRRSKKKMMISYDEWNVISGSSRPYPPEKWLPEGHDGFYDTYNMEESLVFGGMLLTLLHNADRVKIGCQSLLVNAGATIVALRDGVMLNAPYYMLQQAAAFGQGKVLHQVAQYPGLSTKWFDEVPVLDTVPVYNEEKGEVVVFAINRAAEAVEMEIDLRGFAKVGAAQHVTLESGGNLQAMNTAENPRAIVPKQADAPKVDTEMASAVLPAYSWNTLRFAVEK